MKYWLLSQNLLSATYTEKLKNSKKWEEYNLYMWNWEYNDIKTLDDINPKTLNNPTRLDWRYSMIQFKDEMQIWDIIIAIQNKKQIYGIWEIIWDIEVLKHKEYEIINWVDKIVLSRKVKWLYKAEWWFFDLWENNKINQFRRTLAEIWKEDYEKIEKILNSLWEKDVKIEDIEETEEIKEEVKENESMENIVDNFDIEMVNEFNKKILDKIKSDGYDIFEEGNINKLFPVLRIEIIRSWKKLLVNNRINEFTSRQIGELTILFDKILERKQDREQKEKIFKRLFLFFIMETIWLLFLILSVWFWILNISDTTLQILAWATILQVWTMLITITKYLYPNK